MVNNSRHQLASRTSATATLATLISDISPLPEALEGRNRGITHKEDIKKMERRVKSAETV